MPKTYTTGKPVRSFRLSQEGVSQLRSMASIMGRSESGVVELALDRMYREEVRFNRALRDAPGPNEHYRVKKGESEED